MSSLATLFEPPDDATPDELRARLRALADLVARAPVPIAVAHDPDCRFITANDALARLLGVDVGRQHLDDAARRPAAGATASSATAATCRRASCRCSTRSRTAPTSPTTSKSCGPTARCCTSRTTSSRSTTAQGRVCGCVSVCVDMTEQQARRGRAARSRSAEGRIPGDAVARAAQPAGADSQRARTDAARAATTRRLKERALAIMERQLQQLVRLTDDLLDVSRITRNRIELRRDRIDLRDRPSQRHRDDRAAERRRRPRDAQSICLIRRCGSTRTSRAWRRRSPTC